MPIPSYAEAVRYVRRQPRINTSTLADGLGIRWSLALDYLERMERSRVVGAIQDDGWWPVARVEGPPAARKPSTSSPGKGTVLSRGGTAAPGAPPETLNLAAPATPASDPDQQQLMDKLREAARVLMTERENMQKLRDACRLLIAEREAWKRRALAAEARMLTEEADEMDRQCFDALRRVLARELHPDYAPADRGDISLREALFKSIWPKVEQIERKRRSG
ncbi:MAG: hypothetical protein FJX32_14790 [Alphaproteobacteria bacterium]|nr:hypothetical protein [Alphaproteobacteria bacterium]